MINPEKKCEHCKSKLVVTLLDGSLWCDACYEVSLANPVDKPSPSQSCEHDTHKKAWSCGGTIYLKSEHKICPYCKPTAVEPSVKEIAHKCLLKMKQARIPAYQELPSDGMIEMIIAEALRNERNRK